MAVEYKLINKGAVGYLFSTYQVGYLVDPIDLNILNSYVTN